MNKVENYSAKTFRLEDFILFLVSSYFSRSLHPDSIHKLFPFQERKIPSFDKEFFFRIRQEFLKALTKNVSIFFE